jgi:hypothetical protein
VFQEAKVRKRSNWVKRLASGIALSLVTTGSFGDTTNLTCSGAASSGLGMQVTLDTTAKTAVFAGEPVSTATFTNTDVFWQVDYTQAGTEINAAYQLSRSTGAMTRDIVEKGNTNGQNHYVLNCGITKNKF